MEQEECPLLPTEKHRCLDRQRDNKERNTTVVNDQQRENRTRKEIGKRNGRDGTKKYGRKDESGRRRKIDENSSGK